VERGRGRRREEEGKREKLDVRWSKGGMKEERRRNGGGKVD
jgi:hypothetical protein